jgi:peptide/nickel transport system permease protein
MGSWRFSTPISGAEAPDVASYLLQRLGQGFLVVFAMSLIVFLGVYAIGNPVDVLIAAEATQADRELMISRLGLDRPWWEQYLAFLRNLIAGDVGRSFAHDVPALSLIAARFPATLELALVAMVMAVVVGIPLGLHAAMKPETIGARLIMGFSALGFAVPTFGIAILLILVFAVGLGWLPSSGRGPVVEILGVPTSLATGAGWRHVLLPAITLAIFKAALLIRLVHAATREVVASEFVRFARAKGVSPARVTRRHVLRNSLVPVVTVLALEFGGLLAFAVVTETIFAWPGVGRLLLESITMLDRPVIVAYLMATVVLYVALNFVVDVVYAILDPRVRVTGEKA